MNDILLEMELFNKEFDELSKMLDENMRMDDKCIFEEDISNILDINEEIINNLDKIG